MTSMSEDHTRALVEARLAEASARRVLRRIGRHRRTERWRQRRLLIARWRTWCATLVGHAVVRRLAATQASPSHPPTADVARVLEEAAHRVAEQGTASELPLLEAMSEVAADSAPGAAQALVDWAGTEVSRLRAFGVVHAHFTNALGSCEHARLLHLLANGHERAGRVA
jgi:hypothetical protein